MRTNPTDKGAGGVSAFIVEAGTPGIGFGKRDKKIGQKGAHTCDAIFDNCRIPASALIGGVEGRGFKTAMKVLDKGRIHIASSAWPWPNACWPTRCATPSRLRARR